MSRRKSTMLQKPRKHQRMSKSNVIITQKIENLLGRKFPKSLSYLLLVYYTLKHMTENTHRRECLAHNTTTYTNKLKSYSIVMINNSTQNQIASYKLALLQIKEFVTEYSPPATADIIAESLQYIYTQTNKVMQP